MIKAAFFDIDGTLVSFTSHAIPESALEALEAMHRRGIKLFIATGRSSHDIPAAVLDAHKRVPFDGFLTFNGQYCYDASGETFRDCPIDCRDAERIVELTENGVMDIAVMQMDRMFVNRHSPRICASEKHVDSVTPEDEPRKALEASTYQFCAYVDPGEEHLFMDVCEHVKHVRWSPHFCDIIPADGGKPAGIAAALERWGIAPEECVAFGDGGNDVPMFGCVGVSVAMGNASDDVKAAATVVAPDVDEDGLLSVCRDLGIA